MTPVLPQILKKGLLRAAVMMALAGAVFYPAAARACADPVGTEGQIIFNEDYKVLQYCDNVNWIAVGPSPFVTSGALTTPLMSGSYYNATTMNGAHGIMVVGDLAYVTVMDNNRLVILDISNPASPTLVGSVTDGTTLWGAATVVVDGSFAYVTTYYGDSMTIVDVSNPAAPVIRGTISNA
ncbi:MAG: hypothetical protein KKA05_09710, partial [Alphaproteobacteria bacterium]|nr:hypothetical protein [Alphaproteobacteria bacterium]